MSLKAKAKETLELVERGAYESAGGRLVSFSDAQQRAVEGTCLYTPGRLRELDDERIGGDGPGRVEVDLMDATTQVAAKTLVDQGVEDLVLLNFASARNPGGGFLNGAKAQEEDICRCSGLYPALLTQPTYYEVNRAESSLLYTDHMIYSPGVPFFRTRGRDEPMEEVFLAAVITAPAPNGGAMRARGEATTKVEETFARRWRMVLAVARDRGHENVLLGAWGCGAFGNDPAVAAGTALEAVDRYAADFRRVVFAIPNAGRKGAANWSAFQQHIQTWRDERGARGRSS